MLYKTLNNACVYNSQQFVVRLNFNFTRTTDRSGDNILCMYVYMFVFFGEVLNMLFLSTVKRVRMSTYFIVNYAINPF